MTVILRSISLLNYHLLDFQLSILLNLGCSHENKFHEKPNLPILKFHTVTMFVYQSLDDDFDDLIYSFMTKLGCNTKE